MTVRALINDEWHTGETVVSIVHDLYGLGAQVWPYGDPNDTRHGQIVRRASRSSYALLGVVRRVESIEEAHMN